MATENVEKKKVVKKKWKELTKQEKSEKIKNAVGLWVLISFLIPVIFLAFRIVSIDSGNIVDGTQRTKSDYVLMLIQCLLGIVAMIIPNIVVKRKNVQIPSNMYIFYLIFLYCAIFLGEVRSFYYLIPEWDTILHTFSGIMIGALGFSFVSMFLIRPKICIYNYHLSLLQCLHLCLLLHLALYGRFMNLHLMGY